VADPNDRSPVALVVGAGDFIGGSIAKRFAAGGYVAAVGRRKAEQLAPLVAEIEAGGGSARAFALDARDEESVQSVFAAIEKDLGPIEVVVYNVGANVNFSITETTSRVFRKVWEMACFGGFLCGREAARVICRAAAGRSSSRAHRQRARRQGLRGVRVGEVRPARAGQQSMARELGPEIITFAHLVIDAGVDTAWVRERISASGRDPAQLPPDTLMNPARGRGLLDAPPAAAPTRGPSSSIYAAPREL
jgi:NAD(P)-dependent dehydrogenase (short-subunit alcohol dehydrogenase family)